MISECTNSPGTIADSQLGCYVFFQTNLARILPSGQGFVCPDFDALIAMELPRIIRCVLLSVR